MNHHLIYHNRVITGLNQVAIRIDYFSVQDILAIYGCIHENEIVMTSGVPISFFMGKTGLKSAKTIFDTVVPGLGVRVTPKGRQTFVLKYQLKAKAHWIKIGPVELMTLDAARKLAIRMKLIARSGQDPSVILDQHLSDNQISKAGSITFGKFQTLYIEDHAKEFKESWKKDQQRINDFFLPAWRDRSLFSLTREDVSQAQKLINKKHGPIAANRAIETLSKMFNLAVFWGHLPDSFSNPTKGVKRYPEVARERFLTKEEIKRICAVLKDYPCKSAVDAIKLDLYTGLRVGTLLKLRWDWIDWDENTIAIPARADKTKRAQYLPLNEPAMRLLLRLKVTAGASPFVFPGRFAGSHLSRIDKDWRKICKLAHVNNATPHDMRRTVGSWVIQTTGNYAVVGKILNHTNQSTTAIYSRFAQDDIRSALNSFGLKMALHLETENPPDMTQAQ